MKRRMIKLGLLAVCVLCGESTSCSRLFYDKDALKHNFYKDGDTVFRWNGNKLEYKKTF